jgi:hypothetical protein
MEKSETLAELFSALSKAQGQIEAASKGSVNPHFKSRYADLNSLREVIREPLLANDLAVIQAPSIEGNCVAVTTFLTHKSGEFISSTLRMPFGQNTAQAIGSAITYCRRYSLSSILNLAAEDDDGNAATESSKATPPIDVTVHLKDGLKFSKKGTEALAAWWRALPNDVRQAIPQSEIAVWKEAAKKMEGDNGTAQ